MLRMAIALVFITSAAVAATPPLGATPDESGVTFRVWAPFVDGVAVKVNDRQPIPLAKEVGDAAPGDATWSAHVSDAKAGDRYKYVIRCNGNDCEFNDPRALQLTSPFRSAWSVIVDPGPPSAAFDRPALNNTIIYEMHVGTFHADANGKFTFAGAAQKLDYLKDLGINAVELMPVNEDMQDRGHVPADYNWGYDPLSYFAVKSAYGTPAELKDFVDQCHAHGIAAILDVVYNHAVRNNFLDDWGGYSTPDLADGVYFYGGPNGRSPWGPRPDFSRRQVRDYLADNVRLWLSQFGFDGLRWDSVSNMRSYNGDRISRRTANPDGISFLQAANSEFPNKIMIAEDLRGAAVVTAPANQDGLAFNSQWDNDLCNALRRTVGAASDANRDLAPLAAQIERKIGTDAFGRVIYSEDHDQVGHPEDRGGGKPLVRFPAVVDARNPQSQLARNLSNLAATIILTSPGIPMLFQGQEMLDPRTFDFSRAPDMDWNRVDSFAGVVRLYHDLIALRRNASGTTAGLTGQNTQVFHVDAASNTLAYRRWDKDGASDDVIVLINLSQSAQPDTRIGFPSDGKWIIRFNSGSKVYDGTSQNAEISNIAATPQPADGMNFSGPVPIGPYCAVVLSR
jgi:1,4-alpha-glucan branching enzyme